MRRKSNAWHAAIVEQLALHVGIDVVHHTDDKKDYEADVFVDDRSKHIKAWLSAWPGRTAVFWQTLHNTSEPVPWGAHSTSSWDALYQIALETARGPREFATVSTSIDIELHGAAADAYRAGSKDPTGGTP